MLQEADAIVDVAKTERDPLAGQLKLALIPTVGPYLLPHVVGPLRRALPRLKLMLYEYQTAPLLEKLRAGEIDLGILALPMPTEGLETAALYDEPFTLAVPAQVIRSPSASGSGSRTWRRDAAAARGRALPARPGARGLQPRPA